MRPQMNTIEIAFLFSKTRYVSEAGWVHPVSIDSPEWAGSYAASSGISGEIGRLKSRKRKAPNDKLLSRFR
jgi:hypothetical protein